MYSHSVSQSVSMYVQSVSQYVQSVTQSFYMLFLQALSVCTPVITLPTAQNVPGLAAGMIRSTNISPEWQATLITRSEEEYIRNAVWLLNDDASGDRLQQLRRELCENVHRIYNQTSSVIDWEGFLSRVTFR